MGAVTGPQRIAVYLIALAAGCGPLPVSAASFPIDVPMQPSLIPQGGDLSPPNVQALQHQMGLLSGFGSAGLGWTITPRISLEESLTDNVLQAHAPRRADLMTLVAPGISVAGDTDRIQLRLDYQPTLLVYARSGSQDSLTHQLSLTGTATLVPDLLFVNVNGLAGVHSAYGGIGGIGTVGSGNLGQVSANSVGQTQLGLTKQNLLQTTSFSVSPYLLQKFGDAGTLRLGLSLNETTTSRVSGFTTLPFATGSDFQRNSSVTENASFTTGNIFSRIRDTATVSTSQSRYTGIGAGSSQDESFNNRVDYAFDQSIAPYVWLGWDRLQYSGSDRLGLNGPEWGAGAVLTPNPDTNIDVSYGRLNSTTSFRFSGRYGITARTTLTGSYYSGITTQTGLLRQQLDAAAVGNNGGLIDSKTGGSLFQANNALGIAPGIYRFDTLSLGASTVLERDTVSVTLGYSEQTPQGSSHTGVSESAKTAGVSWTHLVNPNLALTADTYVSFGTPSGGVGQNSVAAGLSGNYTLSETVSAFARYAFYERQSDQTALSMYQDLFLVGLTKQF